jgi:hypothetical protein
VSALQGIRVTSSMAGSPAPGVEELSGGYRWRKIPDWEAGDPRYREDAPVIATAQGGAVARSAERAARMAEFTQYRERDLSVAEAGRRVGVTYKTARTYERERLAARKRAKQQRGESRDG